MPERHDPVSAAMRRTLWYVVRRGLRGVWLRRQRASTAALAGRLTRQLAGLDGLAAAADPRQPLPGFTRVIAGRPSWEERVDAWRQPWRPPWRD